MKITLQSPAKINLALDVLGHDPKTGYHIIQTVLHEVPEPHDIITVEDAEKDEIVCNKNILPADNLASRALKLLKEHTKTTLCAKITIQKSIPLNSGLGGGSSNAATTLKALNELWRLKLPAKTLKSLAARLGTDAPFFIDGGTAFATHFGEKITPLPTIDFLSFQINPKSSRRKNKTAQAYAKLRLAQCGLHTAKTEALLRAIHARDPEAIIANLHNDFETGLPQAKNHIVTSSPSTKPSAPHLSGSGPSYYIPSPVKRL